MSHPENLPMSLDTAETLLQQCNCLQPSAILDSDQKTQLRQALSQVAAECDRIILGVCAEHLAEGKTALMQYLTALGQAIADLDFEPVAGPVYLKFNPETGRCYSDGYTGIHRGVLVSCQSDLEQGINGTYGHLPLDLFA
jgi:Domain of unknown function (DUF1824)